MDDKGFKTVYRIETEDGEGPYRAEEAPLIRRNWGDFREIPYAHYIIAVNGEGVDLGEMDHTNHPAPRRIDPGQVCGFKSIDQLRAWFDDFTLFGLSEAGYKLSVCQVDAYEEPDKFQVLFVKDAERTQRSSLLDLLD